MNRAYSTFEVKTFNEQSGVLTGIASTPSPDRMDDIVEPKGAKFNLPIPLLWQHDRKDPIGNVVKAAITDEGIEVVAEVSKDLTSRIGAYWKLIAGGLVRGLSIGFRGLESSDIEDSRWGKRYTKWEWLELSAVTIPANSEAEIIGVKQIKEFDTEFLAASGKGSLLETGAERSPNPASGTKATSKRVKILPKSKKGMDMKPIAEQIAEWTETRKTKSAQMEELLTKASDSGESLDADDQERFDELEAEIKQVNTQIKNLETMEKLSAESAVAVTDKDGEVKGEKAASERRSGLKIDTKRNLPAGTMFTRFAMAMASSKGNLMQASEISKRWDDTPEVENVIKAAVAAGTTTDPAWAAPLVDYQNMTSEFVELLRPQTILGRIPGLRNVPFNIKFPTQTGGSSAGWVGEGTPKPVSALAFGQMQMDMAKVAGIVVITDELARASNPAAEALVRDDMIAQNAQFVDESFVDPARAGVASVSPASITNAATAITATGTSADALKNDVRSVYAAYSAANISRNGGVWLMTETMADSISMMQNPLGQPEFPGMNDSTRTFYQRPVIVSEAIPRNATVGSEGDRIIFLKPSELLLADDGQVMIDSSSEASLQMDDAPDSPVTGGTTMVSLWQHNMIGLRAERYINWMLRRPEAVQYIDSANYV